MPIGGPKSAEFDAERVDWKALYDGLPGLSLVGERLPIFCESFSASKVAFREQGGPDRDTLLKWEKGEVKPSDNKLSALFRAAKKLLESKGCPKETAEDIAKWLARGSPPTSNRAGANKKAPVAPENTQETAEAVASTVSRETPCSPTPELRFASHLEQAEKLLQEAADLLEDASRLQTWPRDFYSRPVEPGAVVSSYPLSERWVSDWLIQVEVGQNHPVLLLHHITEVLPIALAAVQKKRPDEHRSFLGWLLERANQCLWVAEVEQGSLAHWLRQADDWLSSVQSLLSAVDALLERPSSNLSLWRAAMVLREEIPRINVSRVSLFFEEALYIGFSNRLRLLADDWAKAYVGLPRCAQVWLDGLIEEDPRGFSFVLNDEDSIQRWIDAPPYSDWPVHLYPPDRGTVDECPVTEDSEWLDNLLREASALEPG